MTINGVQGAYWEYVTGGGHLNTCPGGARRYNRSLSRGDGTKHKRVQGGTIKYGIAHCLDQTIASKDSGTCLVHLGTPWGFPGYEGIPINK